VSVPEHIEALLDARSAYWVVDRFQALGQCHTPGVTVYGRPFRDGVAQWSSDSAGARTGRQGKQLVGSLRIRRRPCQIQNQRQNLKSDSFVGVGCSTGSRQAVTMKRRVEKGMAADDQDVLGICRGREPGGYLFGRSQRACGT